MVDVLHEMGHIAGLRHEFARSDFKYHLTLNKEDLFHVDGNEGTKAKSLG